MFFLRNRESFKRLLKLRLTKISLEQGKILDKHFIFLQERSMENAIVEMGRIVSASSLKEICRCVIFHYLRSFW